MTFKLTNIIFGISIAIVLAFFIGYAVDTVYESPDYDDFCNRSYVSIDTKSECENYGGKWTESPDNLKPTQQQNQYTCTKIAEGETINLSCSVRNEERSGYCDQNFYCSQEYNDARDFYERNVFMILIIVGLLVVVLSFFAIPKPEHISNGLIGGGLITILYGMVRYWSDASQWVRLIFIGIVLAVLIWLAYKLIPKK